MNINNNIKVSIIIPVCHVEDYMEQCAVSLFSQTWDNLEYIFVDNNSPDNSMKILGEVLKNYPERSNQVIKVFENRKGLGFTRMAGLQKASGEYVIHVDSDDWVEPDYIEKLVTKAQSDSADIVYCDYYKEYEGRPEKAKIVCEKDIEGNGAEDYLFAIHNGKIQAYMWNKLVKRSLYHLNGFVIPVRNMHEDIVFQTQVFYYASKMVHLPEPLYHYRRKRKGAITAGSWFKTRKESAEGLLHLYSSLPKKGSALEYISQDLTMRAGWYALITFNFSTLHSCPEAMALLADMEYKKGRRVPLIKQIILKNYCKLVQGLLQNT